MSDEAEVRPLLQYATPRQQAAPLSSLLNILMANLIAAAVSGPAFVPLASHIWSCNESQKWCYFQAMLLGMPAAVILIILMAFTASITMDERRRGEAKWLKRITWSLWLSTLGVLASVFVAICHNAR